MQLQSHNSIAVLAFDNGEEYPRLTSKALSELSTLLTSLGEEAAFDGVVIASNSKSFATGAEVVEINSLHGLVGRKFAADGQALFDRIARFPVPVVAAIRGFCLGGGFDLALACHERVAAFGASFGLPGASLGLMTGWGGTQRMPRLVGKSTALQLLLTSERIPATQALTLGLVHELASSQDLVECAARRAEALAEYWKKCGVGAH